MPGPTDRPWSPLMLLSEPEAGVWLVNGQHQPYAIIRIIRRGDEVGYRVNAWTPQTGDGEVVGYWRTLEASARQASDWNRARAASRPEVYPAHWVGTMSPSAPPGTFHGHAAV